MNNTYVYTIDEIQNIVSTVAIKYGLSKVYLFGSYAKGSASKDSDVDLCIDASNLKGLFALGSVYADLQEALDKNLDLVTLKSLLYNSDKNFVDNLRKESLLIYECVNWKGLQSNSPYFELL